MATVQSIECTSIFSIIHLLGPFNKIREENIWNQTKKSLKIARDLKRKEMVNQALENVRWKMIILRRHPMNSIQDEC